MSTFTKTALKLLYPLQGYIYNKLYVTENKEEQPTATAVLNAVPPNSEMLDFFSQTVRSLQVCIRN